MLLFSDEEGGVDLRVGDVVRVVGNCEWNRQVIVDAGTGKTCNVPANVTKLTVR